MKKRSKAKEQGSSIATNEYMICLPVVLVNLGTPRYMIMGEGQKST